MPGKRPKVEPIRSPTLFEMGKLEQAPNLANSLNVEQPYSEPGLLLIHHAADSQQRLALVKYQGGAVLTLSLGPLCHRSSENVVFLKPRRITAFELLIASEIRINIIHRTSSASSRIFVCAVELVE